MTSRVIFALVALIAACARPSPRIVTISALDAVSLSIVSPPRRAVANGRAQLFYEVVIRNGAGEPVQVTDFDAMGGVFHRHMDELQLDAVSFTLIPAGDVRTVSDMRNLGPNAPAYPLEVPPRGTALLYVGLTADRSAPTPDVIRNRIAVASGPRTRVLALEVEPAREADLLLSAPLRGGHWIAMNAPSDESPHRRAVIPFGDHLRIPQRFAIDWVKVGDDGTFLRPATDASANESFYGYGDPVYAVSEAVVTETHDCALENAGQAGPRRETGITPDNIAGNFVLLDLSGGRYALYAHLQPGTLRVRPGDRVHRGDVIALLGNSGNSTRPHLHFHVCDSPSPLDCDGVPYVLDRFLHTPMREEGPGTSPRIVETGPAGRATGELTYAGQLIDFGTDGN